MEHIIIIDGSYFVFFRYYAMMTWWKIAKKDTPLTENPIETPEFVASFKNSFKRKIHELKKKHKKRTNSKEPIIMVGKDCPRKDIWRHKYIENYKATRDYSNFYGKPFFKLAYDTLFKESGVQEKLYHPYLEADDCIAIFAKKIKKINKNVHVTIITADHDYLQLLNSGIDIYTLKHKPLRTEKNSTGDAECDLFCKIILGDKSDNIPKVFNRCGEKGALALWNDKNSLHAKLEKENKQEIFERNKKIIDFNEIPEHFKIEFLNSIDYILENYNIKK